MKAADFTPDIPGWTRADKPPNLRDGIVVLASRGYATPKSLILAEVYRVCSDGTLVLHVSVSSRGVNVDDVVKVAWKHFVAGKPIDVNETKTIRMASGVVHIVGLITGTVEP